jgi:hypothetical protein
MQLSVQFALAVKHIAAIYGMSICRQHIHTERLIAEVYKAPNTVTIHLGDRPGARDSWCEATLIKGGYISHTSVNWISYFSATKSTNLSMNPEMFFFHHRDIAFQFLNSTDRELNDEVVDVKCDGVTTLIIRTSWGTDQQLSCPARTHTIEAQGERCWVDVQVLLPTICVLDDPIAPKLVCVLWA